MWKDTKAYLKVYLCFLKHYKKNFLFFVFFLTTFTESIYSFKQNLLKYIIRYTRLS